MAITNIASYAHLTDEDIAAIGAELDQIYADIRNDLGERDVRYIKNLIRVQRGLEVGGRLALLIPGKRALKWGGISALALSKIIENLEIGHNTMHGQWDWMNDPEVHSATWEWDNACPASGWKHSHNFVHHKYTNVIGMDSDVGYGILRVTRDRPWQPKHLAQPAVNVILASLFQWAVAFYDVELGRVFSGKKDWSEAKPQLIEVIQKSRNQVVKDYLLFPTLAGRRYGEVAKANAMANLIRSVWAYAVIFCGHFPDDAETFTKEQYKNEDHNQWYLRQMLGSANFHGGFLLSVLSGNLNYQIEHHLFPDMPSNRLADAAKKVRDICDRYDLPYNTGSFFEQFLQVQRTLLKLTLPPQLMAADKSNAPEVRSDAAFDNHPIIEEVLDPLAHPRKGLRTGLRLLKKVRPTTKEAFQILLGRRRRGDQMEHLAPNPVESQPLAA
ncbi:acyl-CoA desaturase [Corynebacterium sp. TAE3-ERU12]|uniref:fatty acid desaturase family protein n=1 Tax=Corynebacterium sp. TAE3-ERU12 TaxID=2849491 RepID=UPI001C443E8B|nr:acyl-CoA desaturase [Corynebacterium sp. TAE3-ERU12]MBV7294826.1 acyl-CoA desaturase [Corynebacterium sp. TAE3-ERU12]